MNGLRKQRDKFEEISKNLGLEFRCKTKIINRVSCPCCGYPTLDERGYYDICELCDWEDDGQDDENSSKVLGGPNHSYSLDSARENFKRYLIMYSPDNNTTITGGDSEERLKLKKELISVFDKMLFSDKDKLLQLWKKALEIESELYQELKNSIREYEKSIKT